MIYRITAFVLALISFLGTAFNTYLPGKETDFSADFISGERNMEKYCGIYSYAADCGGIPTLYVNDEPFPAAAYMTYFEEYNNYAEFAKAGYNLFSVPVLFAGRWISANDYCKPFHGGIFDKKDAPDFSSLDNSVKRILDECPDAYIFPRVNMSMPVWWTEENTDCTDGTGKRESLYSEKYRETAADMLRTTIEHINQSGYASHIAGYQLAGGNTEEWFHFDLNAGLCKNAEEAFNSYLDRYYPGCGFRGLPDLSPLGGKGPYHKDEHLARYLEFASETVAEDICYFSSAAKEATGRNIVIGTFYGYSLEVNSPLYGTHALKTILRCDDIDFICSPNSYIGTRDIKTDWTEMYPADSVRLHGKICMQECDIRTHLTRLISDAAPEYDPEGRYNAPIWHPLENKETALNAIRRSFSRQLIKGNGFWWFDMWGGWYNDSDILGEMKQMKDIYTSSLEKSGRKSIAETAVFSDESSYKYMTDCALRSAAFNMRKPLGYMGAPYDSYDISDFEEVFRNYKAVIFVSAVKTEYMIKAIELCKKNKIDYLSVSGLKKDFTASELRAFCASHGVHIYCDTSDIVYANGSYLAVHAVKAGEKKIKLDSVYSCTELLTDNGIRAETGTLTITMKENETRLFELKKQ